LLVGIEVLAAEDGVQGLALVTFPAASAIFTSPDGFGFDSTRYGAMFVPQVVLAVLASALAPKVARRSSLRRVLLIGFLGNIASMALLAGTRLLIGVPDMAFAILLMATGALGLGFGATVMALNTYVEAFFPQSSDRAVLVLNALLGVGTALAPVLVALVQPMLDSVVAEKNLELMQLIVLAVIGLFAMRSVAPDDIPTKDIFLAAIPYLVMSMLMLIAIMLWPGIATWLPRALG